jgi:broad specificity phosphatase PhoE
VSSSTGPQRIYLIRHGEKLGDPSSDDDGVPDLSIEGSVRAVALPSLFVPADPGLSCVLAAGAGDLSARYAPTKLTGASPRFRVPAFIFAAAASSESNRPIETVTPLATALGLSIAPPFADKDYAQLATEIKTGSTYQGAIVLVCWHHGNLPNLAEAFGIAKPPAWPGTVFDRVWEIKYDASPITLTDHPQRLLYSDSAT